MSGSSPQAKPVQLSPTIAPKPSPFYGFAKEFGNSYLPQLLNTPYPSYGGQLDPGLSPTMQHALRGAQSYSQSPFPRSLEQASGTLGAFQNLDKTPGSDFQYQFDPSHAAMYRFQQPAFQQPSQAQGPAPDYGFDVKPMAEGGAAGWDILDTPVEVDGYYYDQGGLTHNPNPGGGMIGDSRWGSAWDWIQGVTGFQPGEQHGPNAQFWDANPPAGFDYGRGGPINPTDPMDPNATGYGWWSADPNANGQDMPPWLAGLNDEQMRYVFDLVGNIPPGMRQPSDYQGQRIAGEGLMDWGGPGGGAAGGGGRRGGGGGGGGPKLNFQGIPGYAPPQVDSSFVAWDPGNPNPTMTDPKRMTPDAPAFFSPPPAPPSGGGGGGKGDGGGGRGAGGGGRGRGGGGRGGGMPTGPPMGGGPPAGLPPEILAFLQSLGQGGGPPPPGPSFGAGNTSFQPGGIAGMRGGSQSPGAPAYTETDPTRSGGAYRFPAYAEGNVVDHPQLAMIGEAGPEVVLPLTRPAADPRLQKMQEKLGLPAKAMATGGAAGLYDPSRPAPNQTTRPMPLPTRSPNQATTRPLPMRQPNQATTRPLPMRQPNQATTRPMPTRSPNILGNKPQVTDNISSLTGGGLQSGASARPMPLPMRQPNQATTRPLPTRSPAPAPGFGAFGSQDRAQGAFDAWSGATGNEAGLSFEDWMKPSQANWFKDHWLGRNPENPTANKPAIPGRPNSAGPEPPQQGPPNQVSTGPFSPQQNGLPAQPTNPLDSSMTPPPAPGGGGPAPNSPAGPSSIWDVYNSAVPVMNDIMQGQIQGAAAMGGATGNRFGTSTERNFADIGRQAGNELTGLFSNLLYNQTQADQDRALQATGMGLEDARFRNNLAFQGGQRGFDRALQAAGMGMGAAGMQEQMAQDRLRLPFQMGAWEQDRQDRFAGQAYEDFERNKLGWLPSIMGLLGGQGGTGGMQGQFGVQQSAGSPGFMDYASAFAPYLSLFMAKGGAAGHDAPKIVGGY